MRLISSRYIIFIRKWLQNLATKTALLCKIHKLISKIMHKHLFKINAYRILIFVDAKCKEENTPTL